MEHEAGDWPSSPSDLFPDLFAAVQSRALFGDGKRFADAVPRAAPEAILPAYRAHARWEDAALRRFVEEHFTLPADPPSIGAAPAGSLRAFIADGWDRLSRPPLEASGSALAVPHAHVVPGGRFRELYYWDSYFTLLGLARDRPDLAQDMVDAFTDLIERYGHIPNGTRSYYLGRSQPPCYTLMLGLVPPRSAAAGERRRAAAIAEHRFWMAGAEQVAAGTAEGRVVRLADGALLNRYWDCRATPRDESWREDVATAGDAADRTRIWRDLRAGAESGWDFSSRWLGEGQTLATIRTTAIIPVDLNALLCAGERAIAALCRDAGDVREAARFAALADARHAAIDRHLWIDREGRYADFDHERGVPTPHVSAATLAPLFAGIAGEAQAAAVAALTGRALLARGGLRTTLKRTGQQWDAPNGWAPLQWIAIAGLRRTGHPALADRIAGAWLGTVERHHAATGRCLEKYDVETGAAGDGGEYAVQDGFGWTNGVAAALLDQRQA